MEELIKQFKNTYKNYIPTCSEVIRAERDGKRFYGFLKCKNHGEYRVRGDDLKNRGCKMCRREQAKAQYDKEWRDYCTELHKGKYDYSETVVGNVLTHSNIKCNTCGEVFKQTPASHKSGRGCPLCAIEYRRQIMTKDINYVIEKSKEIGFDYNFEKSVYIDCKTDIEIVCDRGHTFFTTPDELINSKHGCMVCSKSGKSRQEKELFRFISNYFKCEPNNRKVLKGKEIDVFIPELNIGIEYNGLYWHANDKIKTEHFDKLNMGAREDIHMIFVYENDWVYRKEIVKRRLIDTLRVREKGFKFIAPWQVEIKEENTEEIEKVFETSTLQPYINKNGFFTMLLGKELLAIASYIDKGDYKLITEIVRPLKATQTDYYINFIRCFQELNIPVKILASLDWLDDLYLKKLGATFEKLLSKKELYIYKGELYAAAPKENLKTITKTGYAIYNINKNE